MMHIPLSDKAIENIVGKNPEYITASVKSPHFKSGVFEVLIPKKLLEVHGLHLTYEVPAELLVDPSKKGKIGRYTIAHKHEGKLNKILNLGLTNYIKIDVNVAEHPR
jgi:hypothetical protein